MEEKDIQIINQVTGWFNRIFMKYDYMEKKPVEIEAGEKLYASEIHTIEAVGKDNGHTVTGLSEYFMITKGAVSQIISKLYKKGYIEKTTLKGNEKEIILKLTEKGWKAFDYHEKLGESVMSEILQIKSKYSESEAGTFMRILEDIDQLFTKFGFDNFDKKGKK